MITLNRLKNRLKIAFDCITKKPVRYQSIPPLTDALIQQIQPVFVLSTGRCGTKWLTELLSNRSDVLVNHALQPELVRQSKLAYQNRHTDPEFIRAARDDLISAAYHSHRIYIETNNRITFFAPLLAQAYPNSRFIHLYRHPADFIRSGMRRNWYAGHSADIGRITMADANQWQTLSQFEKIAWLWNETNSFIEKFLQTLPPNRYFIISSETLFAEPTQVKTLCEFIGVPDISLQTIIQKQKKPVNVQKKGNFPKYQDWTPEQKKQLANLCPLATNYGYNK